MVTPNQGLQIPLRLRGVFSFFPTCALTPDENKNAQECDLVMLTPDAAGWDPNSSSFIEQEDSFLEKSGELIERAMTPIEGF